MRLHHTVVQRRPSRRRGLAVVATLTVSGALFAFPAAQADPAVTSKDVEKAFHEVEIMNEQVNALGEQTKQTRAEIKDLTDDIERQLTTYRRQKQALGDAIVQQQIDAPLGPTASLLGSDNPDQFLEGLGAVQALNSTRADELATFGRTSKQLKNRRAQLQDRQKTLKDAQRDAADTRAELRKKYEAAKAELDRLTAAEKKAFNKSNTDEDAQAAVKVDVKSASGKGKAALAFAMAQIGEPYVYGGTGPSSWDCSGLVMKSWAAAGVSIPRVVGPQIASGQAVPLDQLQPGDIVAYGDMSHDGLYIGGGRVVHAPRPGKSVEITSMSGFTRAARVG